MSQVLRFSTLDHPEYSDISGEYRVRLEQYLKEWVMHDDKFIKVCRVIFYHTLENDIPMYTISCHHDRAGQNDPDGKRLLEAFETYVKENPIHKCVYCGESISDKNYKFCGNYICSVCEKTAKNILLQKRMTKDLEEWDNR